jgi:hypothetical protein
VNGDGHTDEGVTIWPPQELWRAHVGAGFSQVVVSGGKVYTMGWSNGQNRVSCYSEAATGTDPAPVWMTAYTCAEGNNQGAYYGTYPTPAVCSGFVYTVDNFGNFNCFSATTGGIQWSSSAFSGSGADFAGSPFVEGDLVLVNGGNNGVAALSKTTHSVVWGSSGSGGRYTSPFATTIGGQRVVIGYDKNVSGFDPATGTVLWSLGWYHSVVPDCGIANALIINSNKVFAAQGYAQGCTMANIGSGTLTKVWNNTALCTKENSPVYYNGYVFGIDENNSALKCIDPLTGSQMWSSTSGGASFNAESAVLSASNQIIVLAASALPYVPANNGNLVVVQATSTGYTELHRINGILNNLTFTVPTLCNGQLYVRSLDGTLICYKVGEPPPSSGTSGYRMPIQFTGYKPAAAGTLTNFPAMVVLSNNVNGSAFDFQQMVSPSDGADLRFYTADTVTELKYEIDTWDPNGTSYIWVQVPALAGTNDSIWAYWGDPNSSAMPAYTTNGATWDSNYVGVWHMREAVTNGGIMYDSTSLHNDGVWNATGTSAAGVPGKIGKCIHVNGGGGLLVTDNTTLHVLQQTTWSVWGKSDNPTATGWYGEMMSKRGDLTITPHPGNPSSEIMFANYDGPSGRLGSYCGPAEVPTLDITQWSHWTGVLNANSGDQYVYFNGWCDMQYNQSTFVGGGPMHRSNAVCTMGNGGNLWFGTNPGGNTSGQLMIDEARMEKVPRASNWVWACYMTMASNNVFQTYGAAGGVGATTGIVQFASAAYSVAENGGSVTIRVFRFNGPSGAVSVDFSTAGGTATAGADYVATNGTLNYANGETSKTFTVTILDDATTEPNETVNIMLSHVVGNAIYGTITNTVLTIMDDDGPGDFQFSTNGYAVSQDAGTMSITVARKDGKTGAASVNYATSDGTATNGLNYTATSGTLNFANNETSKTFNITILNQPVGGAGKTVNLTLSNPTGGATLGSPITAVLTIVPPGPFSTWSHSMEIHFPGYTKSEALTNFPVSIVFSNSMGGGFDYSQFTSASGGDLRFSDGMKSNALNFEVEKWATNGASYAWVQVPVMSNGCSIWAYWGSSNTNPPPCTTNGATWNSDFRGVWHLGEINGPSHFDSTANGNNATTNGTTTMSTTGVVDGAAAYTGADIGRITNMNNSLTITGKVVTVGIWVYPTINFNQAVKVGFLGKLQEAGGNAGDYGLFYDWTTLHFDGGGMDFNTTYDVTINAWQYLVGVCDGSYSRLYVNGVQYNSAACSGNTPNNYSVLLGGGDFGGKLNGRLDEGRIMAVGASSNWVWASYMNMASNGTFCSFTNGASGNTPTITSSTTANGTVGSAFSYQITASDSPTSYNATGLPAGLSVNTGSGLISGTPTGVSTSSVTISAVNSFGSGQATLTLTVTASGTAPVITSSTTANGTVGSAFSYQITASGSPTNYNATGLPSGLTVDRNSGLISGTPTGVSTSSVTISAINAYGSGQATLTLTVTASLPGLFGGWAHNMSIQFPGYTSAQALTNFPVLLVFSNNMSGGFNYSQLVSPSGGDLRFSDGSKSNALNFEIEKWVTNGASYVWVQVPVLTNSCLIWAYWGDSDTNPPACTTNGATWNSDFRGVWHLGEASGGTHFDSTSNKNTVAAIGTTTMGTAGVADGAAGYSGSAIDNVTNANGSLSVTAGLTFGAWVQYYDAIAATKNPFFLKGDNEIGLDFGFIYLVNNGSMFLCLNNGNIGGSMGSAPALNTWYYYMATYDQNTLRAYVNGKQVATWSSSSAINNNYASSTHIGGGTWGKLNGKVDESRIMSVASSSNWIWTSYLNMASNGTFCSYAGGAGNPPTITSSTTATGTVGQAFSYQITASGSPTNYNATGLPAGLSVNTGSGLISGTPTGVSTSSVTISAVNSFGSGQATLTLTIYAAPPAPVITSATTATGTVGQAFSYQITASGSPTNYNATGLPSGLTVDRNTGLISGTPTGVSTSSVTISAINSSGTGQATLTLTIYAAGVAPVITSATTATGTVGQAFSYQITASGSPTNYNATGLPSGLTVDRNSGLISGTPAGVSTSSVTISAINSSGTGQVTLTLTVTAAGVAPVITSATTANGTVGSAFSYQITATGSPTNYNATALPAGLTVNRNTGLISGTPTGVSTSSVTISAINSSGTGQATLTLTVVAALPAPVITSATTASGTVGQSFTYQITASSSPTNYNATGLPSGLTVDRNSGLISGTPTGVSTSSVTISAINSSGTGQATLTLTINGAAPVITSPSAAYCTVNFAFSYQITASGSPTNYNATGLPAGLGVNRNTGLISGTPTGVSTSSVTISAINANGTGQATLTVAIFGAEASGGMDWPCFRGPNKDGRTTESVSTWPPTQVWSTFVGQGYSEVVVSGGRVYTMGWSNGQDTVYCFDQSSAGPNPTLIWKASYACTQSPNPSGTRATPTVDGNQVYTLSWDGRLICFNAATGSTNWIANVNVGQPGWGFASSPLVEGNSVIVNAGGSGIAINKANGQTNWSSAGTAAYASPFAVTIGTQRTVVVYGGVKVSGVDPANGSPLWFYPRPNAGLVDPLVFNNKVWISFSDSSSTMGSVLVNIAGSGQLTSTVWTNLDVCNESNPWLYYNGYLYGIGGGGLMCINAATGARVWNSADSGAAYDGASGLVLANDKLIAVNDEWDPTYSFMMAEIVVVPATPTAYSETYRTNGIITLNSDYCWIAPTLSNGKLYLRTYQGTLMCLSVGNTTTAKGTPFSWLNSHGLAGNHDAMDYTDSDGDGALAWQEYVMGTDPTNFNSKLQLVVQRTASDTTVSFPSLTATGSDYVGKTRYYTLETDTNLIAPVWQGIVNYSNLVGNNSQVTYTNASPSPARYYRTKARLQ